jgi:hypothetical protein
VTQGVGGGVAKRRDPLLASFPMTADVRIVTDMDILVKLLQKAGITLHTTIHNPMGMTAVDQGLALIKLEFGEEMHKFARVWPDMFRENMVAEDGARASGILHAVAAKEAEKKETAKDKLLGELSR